MYMKKIFLILALVVVLFFTTNQVSAVTLSCTDSDGGKIYSTQGNLSYAGKSYTDYCYTTNTNYVIEYYCNESGVGKAEYYLCNIGCENGACNSTTCTPNWQTGSWSTCVNDQQTRTVTDLNKCGTTINKPTETQSCGTVCTPLWTCTIWSACTNGSKTQTCSQTNCPSLPLTQTNTESGTTSTACTDSDGGKIYSTQGVLSYGNKSYTDYCYANTNYVIEYYCNESDIGKAEYYLCNGGCENGACKTNSTNPGTCTDTDGGEIYSIRGTTSKDGSSSTDFCSGNTLTEYYCGPNGILTALATCDGGCNAGVCVTTCTPNYNNCGSWSACTNGSKTQTCSQTNCPSLPSTKTNTESCTATCTPNYNNC